MTLPSVRLQRIVTKIPPVIRLAFGLTLAVSGPVVRAVDCRVDVAVDVTEAGKNIVHPTPDAPVYYFPMTAGFREVGDVNPGLQVPRPEVVDHQFAVALFADGYRILTPKLLPSLILVFEWGYYVPHVARASATPYDRPSSSHSINTTLIAPDGTATHATVDDGDAMQRLVGGDWLASPRETDLDTERAVLMDATKVPRYFVIVTALDFQASLNKQRVLLWTARASTEAEGLAIGDALPTLISAAGPMFGKATSKPMLFAAPVIAGK